MYVAAVLKIRDDACTTYICWLVRLRMSTYVPCWPVEAVEG